MAATVAVEVRGYPPAAHAPDPAQDRHATPLQRQRAGRHSGRMTSRHIARGGRSDRHSAGTAARMDTKKLLTMALPIIGGINWGLVAAGRFDLVAKLTGNRFGETNAASRVVYGAVGAASVLAAAELARSASSS